MRGPERCRHWGHLQQCADDHQRCHRPWESQDREPVAANSRSSYALWLSPGPAIVVYIHTCTWWWSGAANYVDHVVGQISAACGYFQKYTVSSGRVQRISTLTLAARRLCRHSETFHHNIIYMSGSGTRYQADTSIGLSHNYGLS